MNTRLSSDWELETLRLTVFTGSTKTSIDVKSMWESIVRTPLELFSQRPNSEIQTCSGRFGDGQLVVKLESQRLDWSWRAATFEGQDGQTTAKTTADPSSDFAGLCRAFLATNPPAIRMAVGALVSRNAQTIVEANTFMLAMESRLTFDPSAIEDCVLRMNTPTSVSLKVGEQLRVNVIRKLDVATWHKVSVDPAAPDMLNKVAEGKALRLDLDINSDASRSLLFSSEETKSLHEHLLKLLHNELPSEENV